MNYNKVVTTIAFVAFGTILVSASWQYPLVLSAILIITAIVKHKVLPIKRETDIYIISGLLGTSVEALIMINGAWGYAVKNILNFPLWLPFLWGLAGILGISLYQGISNEKSKNR